MKEIEMFEYARKRARIQKFFTWKEFMTMQLF